MEVPQELYFAVSLNQLLETALCIDLLGVNEVPTTRLEALGNLLGGSAIPPSKLPEVTIRGETYLQNGRRVLRISAMWASTLSTSSTANMSTGAPYNPQNPPPQNPALIIPDVTAAISGTGQAPPPTNLVADTSWAYMGLQGAHNHPLPDPYMQRDIPTAFGQSSNRPGGLYASSSSSSLSEEFNSTFSASMEDLPTPGPSTYNRAPLLSHIPNHPKRSPTFSDTTSGYSSQDDDTRISEMVYDPTWISVSQSDYSKGNRPRSYPSVRARRGRIGCTEPGCQETFTRQHDRLRHELAQHGKRSPFMCNDCDHSFSSSSGLARHRCAAKEKQSTS